MEDMDLLIPGIQNDVTREFIFPKLSFGALRMLSWVSHPWRRSIQSRQVYDSRVRANSTKSLGIFLYIEEESRGGKDWLGFGQGKSSISLYSMEENCRFLLPPVPMNHGKNRRRFVCVSLGGHLYLLGGATLSDDTSSGGIYEAVRDAYVMNVSGMKWQWEPIASMTAARAQFGCGVVGGKIYAFGGWSARYGNGGRMQREAEVYDPEVDTWSPMTPSSTLLGADPNTAAIGEELFVYNSPDIYPRPSDFLGGLSYYVSHFCEVYNPRLNKWRAVKDFRVGPYNHSQTEAVVVVGENVMKLDGHNVYVYDMTAHVWNRTQSCPFKDIESSLRTKLVVWRLLAMDGEIFFAGSSFEDFPPKRSIFLRTEGLGCNDKEIIWHEVVRFFPVLPDEVFGSIQF